MSFLCLHRINLKYGIKIEISTEVVAKRTELTGQSGTNRNFGILVLVFAC